MKVKKKIHILFLTILCLGSIVCCTPKTSQTVLRFLFDGVPDYQEKDLIVNVDSILQVDSTVNIEISLIAENPYVFHKPYEIKECGICHDKTSMGKLTMSQPELCYMCHDDFSYEYSNVHGPAAGGYCTACHSPHRAKSEQLLLRRF